jgi:cytochrome P450
MLGGADTIQVTMAWVLSLLLNNQEVLKKAQQELDVQIGRERQVKESDIKKLGLSSSYHQRKHAFISCWSTHYPARVH